MLTKRQLLRYYPHNIVAGLRRPGHGSIPVPFFVFLMCYHVFMVWLHLLQTAWQPLFERFHLKDGWLFDGKRKRLKSADASCSWGGRFYLFPEFGDVERGFPDFHNFCLNSGKPMATVLVSLQERCRICTKVLVVDSNTHVVVIYHEQRGRYLALRVTKYCRTCKIYEHYGDWTQEKKTPLWWRLFNQRIFVLIWRDCFPDDTSEAVCCANLLVVDAVPFATFAQTFNRKFGYDVSCKIGHKGTSSGPAIKRMKRWVNICYIFCIAFGNFQQKLYYYENSLPKL